jgi:hypothetical protein
VPASVIQPATHTVQSASVCEPVTPTYFPAPQSVHDATFDAVECLPAAHAVHVVAPVPGPVLVMDPAAHVVQVVSPVVKVYMPAAHEVQ